MDKPIFKPDIELGEHSLMEPGDHVFIAGKWHEIPDAWAGLAVETLSVVYGVSPHPTVGRKLKKRNDP